MDAIVAIEALIKDPRKGLPEEVFLLISRLTPMVNVDLLIKDTLDRTLLTWREDDYFGSGWHIPGGIVRFKELIADRIKIVAKEELGMEVEFDPQPLAINEVIHPTRKDRGHFISLLFRCYPITQPDEAKRYNFGKPEAGQWKWHSTCPDDILPVHEMYRKNIK
uniref:NUDIX hydrolase n=1 Tax=candidate division CPR3 bacterium TaxID=2268181 RepID=A0A7V3N4T5_UNCC3